MYRQLLPQLLRKMTLSAPAIAAAVVLLIGLSGCDNKGDLYLPKDTTTTYSSLPNSSPNYSEL